MIQDDIIATIVSFQTLDIQILAFHITHYISSIIFLLGVLGFWGFGVLG